MARFALVGEDFFKLVKNKQHQVITYNEWQRKYQSVFNSVRTTLLPFREYHPVLPDHLDQQPFAKELIEIEAIDTDMNGLVRILCPVTYFHMNSIANGFLNTPNIPGGITGLVNYFEYDPDLKYNEEAMQRDIEKYGLYTYDDFSDYISEAAYHSSPSVYLKVAVGKGMITYEQIIDVINYLLAGSLID